jgi:hypothetical protein
MKNNRIMTRSIRARMINPESCGSRQSVLRTTPLNMKNFRFGKGFDFGVRKFDTFDPQKIN